MIKREIPCETDLTPLELAMEFCAMNCLEQAQFFNEIADIVKNQWGRPFVFQLQYITDEEQLTAAGRQVMEDIGAYSKKKE